MAKAKGEYEMYDNSVETIEFDEGVTLKLVIDEDGSYANPRDDDHFSHLILKDGGDSTDEAERILRDDDADTLDGLIEAAKRELGKDMVYMLVRRYEHGEVGFSAYEPGASPSSYPWNCPWDSGWYGIIAASRKAILENMARVTKEGYMGKDGKYVNPKLATPKILSKRLRQRAIECLESEVESYSLWANGEVYGYVVEREGEHLDSCWGFLGTDYVEQEGREMAKYHVEKIKKAKQDPNFIRGEAFRGRFYGATA